MAVKLVVHYDQPPVPSRAYDWQVWLDDDPERGLMGNGATMAEALISFFTELEFYGFAEDTVFEINNSMTVREGEVRPIKKVVSS